MLCPALLLFFFRVEMMMMMMIIAEWVGFNYRDFACPDVELSAVLV